MQTAFAPPALVQLERQADRHMTRDGAWLPERWCFNSVATPLYLRLVVCPELAAILAAVDELCLKLETPPERVQVVVLAMLACHACLPCVLKLTAIAHACLQHAGGNKFTVDGAGPFALDLLRGVSPWMPCHIMSFFERTD